MNERPRILALIILLLVILTGSAFIYFFAKVNQAASSESASAAIVIEKGLSTKEVAAKLERENFISNRLVFTLYVYSKGAVNKIQAGEYLLGGKMSIAEIVEIITQGKVISNEHRITIIEGWSNKQIAAYLAQRKIFPAEQFEAAASMHEGFLFPDTYTLAKNSSVDVLISKMVKNFEIKTEGLTITDKVIILASIVEKEVGRNKEKITTQDEKALQRERELVASVFYNRLEREMPLQSDATVNYVTGKKDRQPLLEDIKVKSPYNTYIVKGLPPGPIGNPGLEAIKAAIYPAISDYLYFLNKPDGEAVFARTIEEHNENRKKYLD